jgi:hypothetical protein
MKIRVFLALALLAVLVVGSGSITGRSQKRAATGQIWEYKILTPNLMKAADAEENDLNKLGAEGWELVMVRQYGNEHEYEFYFKRPR